MTRVWSTHSICFNFTVIVQNEGNTLNNNILAYLYHLSNTMTTNDYKWAKIVIYLSRIYRVTPCCLWVCDFMKFSRRPLENFTRSRKNKTVTFKDCIVGIYGSNINDFQALPHAVPSRWFNPTFACPWKAVNVPSNFEFISYRNNLRRKLSIYFNKTRPLLNSYSKRRLAATF